MVCEYDCLIRGDITPDLQRLVTEEVDFAAAQLGRRSGDWSWSSSLSELPGEKHGRIFPFVFASARAVDRLFVERLRMSAQARITSPPLRPFCEGFVLTVLRADPAMRLRRLEEYFDLAFCRVQPAFDPTTAFPEAIRLVHPFLDDLAEGRKQGELQSLIRAHRASKAVIA